MNWFYLALVGPITWSISTQLDKIILIRYFKQGTVAPFVLITAFFELFALPFIAFFAPGVLNIPLGIIGILVLFGAIAMLQLLLYLYALNQESASVVVPLFQIIPVFTYILSYIVLGETLTTNQILGGIFIIIGAIILSLDLDEKKPKLKTFVLVLMLISCLLASIFSVVFKTIALQDSFWVSTFWTYVGAFLFGISLLVFKPSYRKEFSDLLTRCGPKGVSLNFINEAINLLGFISFNYATLLAPIALVQLVNGFQPLFVLLIGIFLTIFIPKYGQETLTKKHLGQKFVAIGIIFVGTFILTLL